MNSLVQDVRYGVRSLLKVPTFTIIAILTLAIGIGATSAIFSVVNAVLLKPLPFPGAEKLVMLQTVEPGGAATVASPTKFFHWRQQNTVLEDVAAFRDNVMNYTGGAIPEQLRAAEVSADYFRLFGAPIIHGRSFTAVEDQPNGGHVVLLSQRFWTSHFAADRSIVGRTVLLSGDSHTVIGIVSSSFDVEEFGPRPDVWVPFQLDPNSSDHGHYFSVAGRLKQGVSLDQANAGLRVSTPGFKARFPKALDDSQTFGVTPLSESLVGDVRQTLMILLGAVGFVLMIVCANVANLMLVRASTRRRELAVRRAMGASRGQIVRQLLTESILLSTAGGAVGMLVGFTGIRALLAVNTAGLPRLGLDGSLVAMDWRVLGFAVGVSIASGLLFGVAPALHGTRANLNESLKGAGGRGGTEFRHNKTRAVLVVSEVALALVLLVGAGLLIRTSLALRAVEPGFDGHNVLTMRMSLTGSRFLKSDGVDQMIRAARSRLEALPGIEIASTTCCIPLETGYTLPFNVIGRPAGADQFHGFGDWRTVSPAYFELFRISVRRGRTFSERDNGGAPPVVIINEAMARRFWKDADPLYQQIVIGKGTMREFDNEPPRQIIGVVADTRDDRLNNEPAPMMFIPQAQVIDAVNALTLRITPLAWVVRTRTAPESVSAAVQEELRRVTGLPVTDVRSMSEVVSRSTSRQRFNMLLMTTFGWAALVLAAIGIYGLMAYSVQQRTQELGIRMALGALAADVQNMIVFQGMRLALAGIIIGIGAAFLLARVLTSVLFGVEARDPGVFVGIPILLCIVALAAAWLPARRASKVDPIIALRYQ